VTITWGKEDDLPSDGKNAPDPPDYHKVMDEYDQLIARFPDMAFAYYNRANLKLRMKDYQGAIQDFSKAIEKQPTLAEAYFNRGLTLIYLHEINSACQDMSKAGELGMTEAYKVIGIYCKKGN
jgi:tetratricopeptide (TPR) repeat protein